MEIADDFFLRETQPGNAQAAEKREKKTMAHVLCINQIVFGKRLIKIVVFLTVCCPVKPGNNDLL
jgi:hypothetical protein